MKFLCPICKKEYIPPKENESHLSAIELTCMGSAFNGHDETYMIDVDDSLCRYCRESIEEHMFFAPTSKFYCYSNVLGPTFDPS